MYYNTLLWVQSALYIPNIQTKQKLIYHLWSHIIMKNTAHVRSFFIFFF